MTRERYVLLGLARARSEWFRSVGQWATSAMLPAEFVRCVSVEELRTRLASGRAFSTVIVDGRVPGLDRDLVASAAEAGIAVLVVDGEGTRDWHQLGAAAVLTEPFSRDELLEVLAATSTMIGAATFEEQAVPLADTTRRGELVAVTGTGGAGTSTAAIALAQGLAAGEGQLPTQRRATRTTGRSQRPRVLLADLCRQADQAMLHDSRIVVPGIQEVVEAHRTGSASPATLLDQTFDVPARGYRLLLGLRRSRHWVSLRPRAFQSALDSFQALVDVVVADVEADLEGEAETGSSDVEDRNLLARATLARAGVVVVVGGASLQGVYALVRTIGDVVAFGVPPDRVLPVVNLAPRRPRTRAEITTTLAQLVDASVGVGQTPVVAPVFLPERPVDRALRDGVPLPDPLPRLLARAVSAVHERAGDPPSPVDDPTPQRVVPGSLSAFSAEES